MRRELRWALCVTLATSFAILLSAPLSMTRAQQSGAQIQGAFTDQGGAAIPSVIVTIINTATGVRRTITTGEDGRFTIGPLPPGTYALSAEKAGFARLDVSGIVLQIGTTYERNFQINLSTVQQEITVSGAAPAVDVSKSNVYGEVTQEQITTLPVNTRQFLNLALIEPGTSQDATRTFYNNVQIGAGDHYYANGFHVDGVNNTWAEMGEPRQNFPEGAVQEFKVYDGQYSAEYGLSSGGMVDIVTKSGTNQFHGEAFEYFRDTFLNAENKFQALTARKQGTGKPPFHRNQFGADFGGPIIRNRLHFYTAFERTDTLNTFTVYTGPNAQTLADYAAFNGTFRQPYYDDMLTGRADYQINNNQSMFVRYAQEWNLLTCQGCGGTTANNDGYDGKIPRRSLVVGHTWTPSTTIVNDARFQYALSQYLLGPTGYPISSAQGVYPPERLNAEHQTLAFPNFRYGGQYSINGREARWEGNDVVSLIKGSHNFKFGFDMDYVPYDDDDIIGMAGTWTFASNHLLNPSMPSTFLGSNLNDPISYTQTVYPPNFVNTRMPTFETGYFVEDQWRANRKLTLSLGLRYDREYGAYNERFNPTSVPFPPGITSIPFQGNPHTRGGAINLGPRVGISWDPTGAGREVLRAGYGIYYDNIQTEQNEGELQNFAICSVNLSGARLRALSPYSGYPSTPFGSQSAANFCASGNYNVTIVDPKIQNPYVEQYNLGWSQGITSDLTLSVDGIYSFGNRDYRVLDLNYTNAQGVRPYPQFGQITDHDPMGKSKYDAMYLRLEKRLTRRYQYLISYTLSSTRDNNFQSTVVNPLNYRQDWGPASTDRRNVLVASGAVELPWKFTFGAIWQWRSSLPFSVFQGTGASALNADGVRQYVPGTTRNQGNRNLNIAAVNAYIASVCTPVTCPNGAPTISASQFYSSRFNSLDIRLSRSFSIFREAQVELLGQVFNLFGTTNYNGGYNTIVTTSASSDSLVGQLTSANNAQQGELAIRFVF